MLEFYEQIVKLSPIPSSIDILSPAPVPVSASAGVELGTAQPQLVILFFLHNTENCFILKIVSYCTILSFCFQPLSPLGATI